MVKPQTKVAQKVEKGVKPRHKGKAAKDKDIAEIEEAKNELHAQKEASRSERIQKRREDKDALRKFYQHILIDLKKSNNNSSNSINDFLVHFKKDAWRVN